MTIEWLETENKVSGESIEQACGTRVAIRGTVLCPGGDQKKALVVSFIRKKTYRKCLRTKSC